MSKQISVYSPDGVEEKHTLLNAYDLVKGAGYSYDRQKPTQSDAIPVNAPSSVKPKRIPKLPLPQEVLNKAGAPTSSAEIADADEADDETSEEV